MKAFKPHYEGIEEWRKVAGHEMYEASSWGRIRSMELRGLQKDKTTPTLKVARPNRLGYDVVGIKLSKGVTKPRYVHRLVCMAFHGPCPEGCTASHLDGNSLNNAPSNLVWETMLENIRRKREHGTQYHGEEHGRSKLTQIEIEAIRAERLLAPKKRKRDNNIYSLRNIAKRYGLHWEQVRRICLGGSWDWLERNPKS
jgi:hypothetical protein